MKKPLMIFQTFVPFFLSIWVLFVCIRENHLEKISEWLEDDENKGVCVSEGW